MKNPITHVDKIEYHVPRVRKKLSPLMAEPLSARVRSPLTLTNEAKSSTAKQHPLEAQSIVTTLVQSIVTIPAHRENDAE
jgi:hypothetical protein